MTGSDMPSRGRRAAPDDGVTLIELLVALSLITVVMIGFFVMFLAFANSATGTRQYTFAQEQSLTVVRVLEADVRSADPLLVASPFGGSGAVSLDRNGTASAGPNGVGKTDVIAMYETNDRYSPCFSGTVTPPPFTPFTAAVAAFSANVVWAYDPGPGANAGVLTRYSYCPAASPQWQRTLTLRGVTNTGGTMFQVAQDTSGGQPLPQASIPSPTSVPNQSVPVCGNSLQIVVKTQNGKNSAVFTARGHVPLENEGDYEFVAC